MPSNSQLQTTPLQRVLDDIDTLIRSRYPIIYLVTHEENRVEGFLEKIAARQKKPFWTWTVSHGLRQTTEISIETPLTSKLSELIDPVELINNICTRKDNGLFVLKDFHTFLEDPFVVRRMRECASELKSTYRTIFIISPRVNIPPELEKDITIIDIPLPDVAELMAMLRSLCTPVARRNPAVISISEKDAQRLVQAAQGLTLSEAENVFSRAIVTDGQLNSRDIDLILKEKQQIIRKSGTLEFFSTDTSLSDVGGLENLKLWLDQRYLAFSDEAKAFGLSPPRGILLLGAPGCGKSLTAKAIASSWKLPLLRLDFGRVFAGLMGSSEENIRKSLLVAESIAPAILWIDEIEKGLSGNSGGGGSGQTDGGTGSRVFATFLTWMQEKAASTFVIATANRIEALPPELLRRGRFDEIFFVDLPSAQVREQIFSIHLKKRQRDATKFNLQEAAASTEGFSGAEIEYCVIEALFQAFYSKQELATAHLLEAAAKTVPLSRTYSEELERLRDWASTRTRPADAAPQIKV